MKTLAFLLVILPAAAPAQTPAYRDPGMKVVTQVAIVCRDIEATSKRWAAVLGVDPPRISTTKPGHGVKVMFRGHTTHGRGPSGPSWGCPSGPLLGGRLGEGIFDGTPKPLGLGPRRSVDKVHDLTHKPEIPLIRAGTLRRVHDTVPNVVEPGQ